MDLTFELHIQGQNSKGKQLSSKKPKVETKFFREMDKRAALSDAEKARKEELKKTAKLRALRLAKEEEERIAAAANPKKKAKKAKRRGLPAFERDV